MTRTTHVPHRAGRPVFRRFNSAPALALALAILPASSDTAADPLPGPVADAFRAWRSDSYDYDPPAPGTYALPPLGPAADGTVLGADGKPVRLHELMRGRLVVLSFIYTRCADPKACLLATGVLGELRRLSELVPGLAERMLLVSLSFDPAHDTPDAMARYGRVAAAGETGAEWLFLTTRSHADLQPLLDAYGQRVDTRRRPVAAGPLSHPLRVYLVDDRQRIRNIYSDGLFDPRLVFTDILTVAADPDPPADAISDHRESTVLGTSD